MQFAKHPAYKNFQTAYDQLIRSGFLALNFLRLVNLSIAGAVLSFSFQTYAAGACLRNSDCYKGLICGAGQCVAECAEDVDCPGQGVLFKCSNTLNNPLIPKEVGGGINAFQCIPRADFIKADPRPRIFPELFNKEIIGDNLWTFANLMEDPQICALECAKQKEDCKAWVMFKHGVQGEFARCWLKKTATSIEGNGDSISGYQF